MLNDWKVYFKKNLSNRVYLLQMPDILYKLLVLAIGPFNLTKLGFNSLIRKTSSEYFVIYDLTFKVICGKMNPLGLIWSSILPGWNIFFIPSPLDTF